MRINGNDIQEGDYFAPFEKHFCNNAISAEHKSKLAGELELLLCSLGLSPESFDGGDFAINYDPGDPASKISVSAMTGCIGVEVLRAIQNWISSLNCSLKVHVDCFEEHFLDRIDCIVSSDRILVLRPPE